MWAATSLHVKSASALNQYVSARIMLKVLIISHLVVDKGSIIAPGGSQPQFGKPCLPLLCWKGNEKRRPPFNYAGTLTLRSHLKRRVPVLTRTKGVRSLPW